MLLKVQYKGKIISHDLDLLFSGFSLKNLMFSFTNDCDQQTAVQNMNKHF